MENPSNSKYINSHIITELFGECDLLAKKIPLLEEKGAVPYLLLYLERAKERFAEEVQKKPKSDFYHYTMDETDFQKIEKKFFSEISIEITAFVNSYPEEDSNIDKRNGFDEDSLIVENDRISFKIQIYSENLDYLKTQEFIYRTFGHELTHAYQAVCETKEGNTLRNSPKLKAYYNISKTVTLETNTIRKNIANFMYFTHSLERNAFIGQCKADLELIKNEIMTLEDVKNTPTKLPLFQDFSNMWQFLDDLYSLNIPEWNKIAIETFNSLSPNFKVTTLKQLVKKLQSIISKYFKKYYSHVISIAMEIYKKNEKNKISETDNFLSGKISVNATPLRGHIFLNEDGSVVNLQNLEECQEMIEKVSKIQKRPWLL